MALGNNQRIWQAFERKILKLNENFVKSIGVKLLMPMFGCIDGSKTLAALDHHPIWQLLPPGHSVTQAPQTCDNKIAAYAPLLFYYGIHYQDLKGVHLS
ncbi:hypothetical protein FRC12_009229 [Ceratobasidium sp. 428]|nr:hypothetical protein FRC12_009229 [Ceratobasidium sp. 428]